MENAVKNVGPTTTARGSSGNFRPRNGEQPERAPNSIHVGVNRPPKFYSRLGANMLHGTTERKPTQDEILITGLGLATRFAIGAACIMQQEKQGYISSIETSYFASTRGVSRRVPKITIKITKNPVDGRTEMPEDPHRENHIISSN